MRGSGTRRPAAAACCPRIPCGSAATVAAPPCPRDGRIGRIGNILTNEVSPESLAVVMQASKSKENRSVFDDDAAYCRRLYFRKACDDGAQMSLNFFILELAFKFLVICNFANRFQKILLET